VALESRERYALGAIETRPNGGLKGIASRFELYYLKQPRGGHLVVFIDGKRVKRVSTYSKVREAGYQTFEVKEKHHRFEVRSQNDGVVRIFGVAVERATPGVILDTVGIPGARVEYHLLWNDAIYREHLAKRNPDLIVLAYGTNEAGDDDVPIETYEEGLRRVMKRIREVSPDASCVLIGPSDRPLKNDDETFGPRPRTGQIVQSQRRISEEFSCGFFDLVALMGGPMSMLRWVAAKPPLGAADHVHYTYKGYKTVGEVFYQALVAGYPYDNETSLNGSVSENRQIP
jgi:lysophospholipase L1-like esterase